MRACENRASAFSNLEARIMVAPNWFCSLDSRIRVAKMESMDSV